MSLGERIKERRKALKMTQVMLAEKAGIQQGYISRYENGESEPLASSIAPLAEALQVSSDWLLGITDEPPDTPQTEYDLDALEKEVINVFRSFPEPRKPKMIEILKLAK